MCVLERSRKASRLLMDWILQVILLVKFVRLINSQ